MKEKPMVTTTASGTICVRASSPLLMDLLGFCINQRVQVEIDFGQTPHLLLFPQQSEGDIKKLVEQWSVQRV